MRRSLEGEATEFLSRACPEPVERVEGLPSLRVVIGAGNGGTQTSVPAKEPEHLNVQDPTLNAQLPTSSQPDRTEDN
jgi:hypothetical protein